MSPADQDQDPFGAADLDSYDSDLNQGLSLSGEGKDYFASGRLEQVAHRLSSHEIPPPARILDYGCGPGNATLSLSERWPQATVVGVDTSESLVAVARANAAGRSQCRFDTPDTLPADQLFDLVYCNGVFHHIPVAERQGVLAWIYARMAPGAVFALWENNSWNPGTRWVMRRIPFDRDAVLLSPRYAVRMLRKAGYESMAYDFAFIFPKCLKALRPLERFLCKLPLGAQYQVVCRKPAEPIS